MEKSFCYWLALTIVVVIVIQAHKVPYPQVRDKG